MLVFQTGRQFIFASFVVVLFSTFICKQWPGIFSKTELWIEIMYMEMLEDMEFSPKKSKKKKYFNGC